MLALVMQEGKGEGLGGLELAIVIAVIVVLIPILGWVGDVWAGFVGVGLKGVKGGKDKNE